MSQIDVLRKNRDDVAEMWNNGFKNKEIVDKYNVSIGAIKKFAFEYKNNIVVLKNMMGILRDNENEIRKMVLLGATTEEIAKKFGVSKMPISHFNMECKRKGKEILRKRDINILRDNENEVRNLLLNGNTFYKIGKKFNVSSAMVNAFVMECRKKGKEILLPKRKIDILRENVNEICKLRNAGINNKEIAKKFEVSTSSVVHLVEECKKKGKKLDTLHDIREQNIIKFFSAPMNKDLAYVASFIIGDGYVIEDRCTCGSVLGISLAKKDKSFLYSLCNLFDFNFNFYHHVGKRQDGYSYRFRSKKVCKILEDRFGIVPRKTGIEYYPEEIIGSKYENVAIRACIDSDGTIYMRKNNKNITLGCGYVTASKSFASVLKNRINELIGIDIKVYNTDYYRLHFSGNKALKFCDFIYKDSGFCLERKKNKYLEYKKMKGL